MEMKDEVRVENMHLGGVRTAVNEGAIEVKLKPAEERKRGMLDIMADLRGKFRNVGDMQVAVVTNQGSRGDPRPVQIGLRGSDLVRLTKYANDLAEKIRQVPGSADVEVIGIDPEPEIMIRLDQSKASQLGLDNTTVGKVVQYAFQGKSTGNSYGFYGIRRLRSVRGRGGSQVRLRSHPYRSGRQAAPDRGLLQCSGYFHRRSAESD